jgi:hypothetical protein
LGHGTERRYFFEHLEPDRIGRELFMRLQAELPGVFPDGQLLTFQRRVRDLLVDLTR